MTKVSIECRGCGVISRLYYGLCLECRFKSPHKRPLNPKYRSRVKNRKGRGASIHLEGRKYLVCGCDYIDQSLDVKPHSAQYCPNRKVITIARGHDEGGKGR